MSHIQHAHRWKVMELKIQIFRAWKVMESGLGAGKSGKIKPNGCCYILEQHTCFAFACIMIIAHCQIWFSLLFCTTMNLVTYQTHFCKI